MSTTAPEPHEVANPAEAQMFVGPRTMPTDEAGWWETERATFIRHRIAARTKPGSLVLDVGCGRGTMLDADGLDDRMCVGVDGHIWDEWSRPGTRRFVCAEADALPFRENSFDLVGSFDVLEHLADDDRGLGEQRRVLRADGVLVTAVPADPRLWSAHDEAVGHQRRYTRTSFTALASRAGLTPTRSTYFFSFLWLPARVLRSSELRQREPVAAPGRTASTVRRVIEFVCAVERRVTSRVSLPFGTSLWIESEAER